MIRSFINLTATTAFGLSLVAVVVMAYNGASYSVAGLPGAVWNYRGTVPTATPVPVYAAGVTLPTRGGASSIAVTPTSVPPRAVGTSGSSSSAVAPVAEVHLAPVLSATERAAECAWAVKTLRLDARYDGYSARYNQPESQEYYARARDRWTQLADQFAAQCATPWPAAQCTDARQWLMLGAASHWRDSAWDKEWKANYWRIDGLLWQVCPLA